MSEIPPTAFAADGDSYIAYQVLGDGEHDVLYVPTAVHPIDLMWDDPVRARGLRRLALTNRLIACDLIGVGSSDPVLFNDMPAMQAWGDGLRVVLDAAGSEQASIFAMAEAGLPVMLFAASHPERVRSLVLWAGYARFARTDDYPFGMPELALRRYLDSFWEVVGTGNLIDRWAPSRADEVWFREWWGRGERLSGGRRYLSQIVELFLRTDVRGVLEAIQAPTLVLRRRDDPHVREGHAQFLVEHIPDARVVELPGNDHEWFSGNTDEVLDAIEEFLTGRRTAVATNRVLATVLFTDIVASTERAAALGDSEWTRVIDAHEALVSRIIASHRGHVVKFTGDGVLATFDGPARAIECAVALVSAAPSLGLEIRAGLHTGEIEIDEGDIRGIGVHIAARIMALAGSSEVFVSGSIPPLVLGSGLQFDDLGARSLKGVPEPWPVFRLRTAGQAG